MQDISPFRSVANRLDVRQKSEDCDKKSGYDNRKSIVFDSVEEIEKIDAMKSSTFDEITIGGVLEYMDLSEQIEFMKECERIISRDGVLKIRVPIIRDRMLIDYYGWNNRNSVILDDDLREPDHIYSKNTPKCSFTPSSINLLAREAGLFVTGAFLSDVYFYEATFKKDRSINLFTSAEIVHNIYFCVGHRICTSSELEYWAKCLDQGMKIEKISSILKVSICNYSENLDKL